MGCAALLGLGLTGAGAGLGVSAANAEQTGMNNAISADLAQMQRYQNKGQGLWNQAFQGSTPQAANQIIGQGQQQFTNAAKNAQSTGFGFATPLNATNTAVSNARGAQGAQAMGNWSGYGTLPQAWQNQSAVLGPQIAVNNQQAAARNSLLPALIGFAQRSQQGRSSLGSLLGGLGNLVSGAGAMSGSNSLPAFGSTSQYQQPGGLWTPMANAGY